MTVVVFGGLKKRFVMSVTTNANAVTPRMRTIPEEIVLVSISNLSEKKNSRTLEVYLETEKAATAEITPPPTIVNQLGISFTKRYPHTNDIKTPINDRRLKTRVGSLGMA